MGQDDLQRLVDRDSITFLLNEYCRTLDAMDLDALAEIFTVDCVVDYGPEARLQSRGRADLRKALERMWRWRRTSHHLSNIQITFTDADNATAGSYVIAWHERPDGTTATVWAQYRDSFVRTPRGWRLAGRRQVMNGHDAGFRVNLFPNERFAAPPGWVAPNIDGPPPAGTKGS